MLEISGLSFSWPGRDALLSVDLSLDQGEILALLGPNGAGKSTLVRTILGQLKPSSGTISFNGKQLENSIHERSGIAWVPQQISIFPKLTVDENLQVFAEIMGVARTNVQQRVDSVLELVGLSHRQMDFAGDLSGGMQRMLNVGIALISSPDVIVLDEPTAGIDARARVQLHRTLLALRKEGKAILLTTHDLDDAKRLADRVAILVDGKMCAQGPVTTLIRETFAQQRELLVQWPEGETRHELQAILKATGLIEQQPGLWLGLVDNEPDAIRSLIDQLLTDQDFPPDVSLREPSLDMFIKGILAQSEPV